MIDCIIIGGGPAGVSAALYTAAAGFKTRIIAKDVGALKHSERIMNYYGFPGGISGAQLQAGGIEQAAGLGAEFAQDEIFAISPVDGGFELSGAKSKYLAKTVLIATGTQRNAPSNIGIAAYEGAGVSYCAVCDGFFYRGKKIAVLGDGEYAIHELADLENFTKDITLLTNGSEAKLDGVKFDVDRRRIKSLFGEGRLAGVLFDDGSELRIDGLFVALGSAGAIDFARSIGIVTEGGKIITDRTGATNVPGIFAAGDCTENFKQVSVAVGSGAAAGHKITTYLRKA